MALANRQFLPEEQIRRDLYHNAPYAPFCSDNKTAGIQLPRREAFTRQYVQLNPPCNYKVFVIDIDHEEQSLWNNDDVPTPNAIIRNKDNDRVHLLYRIDDILLKSVKKDVVVKDGPIQYAKAVYYGLCEKLGADKAAFNNVVSKNPYHSAYDTEFIHSRIYKLKELADFAEPDWSVYKWGEKENPNPESRNLSLFHKVRFVAYGLVQRYRLTMDMEGFYKAVLAECQLANQFKGKGFKSNEDLPASQVKAIAKNIATWTWNKYTGNKVNRGVMALPHDMEQKEKQKRAAEYVAQQKRERTIVELSKVVGEVVDSGEKLTQARVADSSKHSLSTVKRYWAEITKSNQGCINSEVANIPHEKVSLGVHKVSSLRGSIEKIPDVEFNYKLSVFRLNRFKKELNIKLAVPDISGSLVSMYRYDSMVGRLTETGSDINIQTLKKTIRKELFKGWYEIDLTFSHGQMLAKLLCDHVTILKQEINKLVDRDGHLYGSFIEPLIAYKHFIRNMDSYFEYWSARSGVSSKTIKTGLVAMMNGARDTRLNKIYGGKLDRLMADTEFFEVYTSIHLARKAIPNLGLKLRELEVEVFKPYWGRGLVIHDAILVNDPKLAKVISQQIGYVHKSSKL